MISSPSLRSSDLNRGEVAVRDQRLHRDGLQLPARVRDFDVERARAGPPGRAPGPPPPPGRPPGPPGPRPPAVPGRPPVAAEPAGGAVRPVSGAADDGDGAGDADPAEGAPVALSFRASGARSALSGRKRSAAFGTRRTSLRTSTGTCTFAVMPGLSFRSGFGTSSMTGYVTTFWTVCGDRRICDDRPLEADVREGVDREARDLAFADPARRPPRRCS